jgi:hypothetical protein
MISIYLIGSDAEFWRFFKHLRQKAGCFIKRSKSLIISGFEIGENILIKRGHTYAQKKSIILPHANVFASAYYNSNDIMREIKNDDDRSGHST